MVLPLAVEQCQSEDWKTSVEGAQTVCCRRALLGQVLMAIAVSVGAISNFKVGMPMQAMVSFCRYQFLSVVTHHYFLSLDKMGQ